MAPTQKTDAQKCVFLDRDGVLNEDLGDYLYRIEDLIVPDGVAEALQLLKSAGYLLIVITNQAGIAKGMYGREEVHMIHDRMQEIFGVKLDDIYFSPYHPVHSGNSLSRKPGTLMLEKAISKYHIDTQQSWMIGDRIWDMQAGQKAGLQTIQIITEKETSAGHYAANNLLEAAKIILNKTA